MDGRLQMLLSLKKYVRPEVIKLIKDLLKGYGNISSFWLIDKILSSNCNFRVFKVFMKRNFVHHFLDCIGKIS